MKMDQQYLTDISYRHFIESVKDYAIYILNLKGVVISWNKGAERAKGYTDAEIIGKYYGVFYSLEDQMLKTPAKNLECALKEGHYEGEGWRYKKNGDRFWAHIVIDPIYDYKGSLEGFAKITKDITEQKNFLDKISYLAKYDTLTDSFNRNEFFTIVQKHMNTLADNKKLAICMLGVDTLKEIISNRGYQASDKLIKIIADKIKYNLAPDEILARFSNDQFIILKTFDPKENLSPFYKRVYSCSDNTYSIDYREFLISIGIGSSIYPDDANNLIDLVNNAETAMIRAYKKINDRICHYDKKIDGKNQTSRMLAHDMLSAIDNNEFFILYQRKYSLKYNDTSGYEALLRWQHPKLGLISPELFIPVAEETGKIIRLGYWVLETVCKEALSQKINKKISVNLSSVQLRDPRFIEQVKYIIETTGYPVEMLELEVTETAFINDKSNSFKQLKELQSMGISISLDDFGTGYSSLKLLHDFRFDCIKLDRSFISDIEYSQKSVTFLHSIISLVNSINIPLIAEGVENEIQLNTLKNIGCQEIQGYIFGKPEPLKNSAAKKQDA